MTIAFIAAKCSAQCTMHMHAHKITLPNKQTEEKERQNIQQSL